MDPRKGAWPCSRAPFLRVDEDPPLFAYDDGRAMNSRLQSQADALRWYHTIDLGDGVVTRGVDDTAFRLRRIDLPVSLDGRTVLDIGAWDGFFSFEAERRGASRVVAADHYSWHGGGWGSKAGFELARTALGSRVEDVDIDVMYVGRFLDYVAENLTPMSSDARTDMLGIVDSANRANSGRVDTSTVLAAGDSYIDTSMLKASDRGILCRCRDNVAAEFPQYRRTEEYGELRDALLG